MKFKLFKTDRKFAEEAWVDESVFDMIQCYHFCSEELTFRMVVQIYEQYPNQSLMFLSEYGKIIEISITRIEDSEQFNYEVHKDHTRLKICRTVEPISEELKVSKSMSTYNQVIHYILNNDFLKLVH